ncbi:hypothetical protein [Sphingobium aromaticiconvertens]|uniref:hypothetical protein n=1 Tax=Sphingobium aromaticiconvertens TaxID=365341 RepID=UPI003018CF61
MSFVLAPRMRDPVQAAWTLLRFAGRPMTVSDIIFDDAFPQRFAGGELGMIIQALNGWRGAGLIDGPKKPETFIMRQEAKALRNPPAGSGGRQPAKRSGRQRIWTAMRVLKSFDLVHLCITAEVERKFARHVLGQLTRAGYLASDPVPKGDQPRWRVVRRTGPHHPSIEYTRGRPTALRDRLTGERFDLAFTTAFFLKSEVNYVQ